MSKGILYLGKVENKPEMARFGAMQRQEKLTEEEKSVLREAEYVKEVDNVGEVYKALSRLFESWKIAHTTDMYDGGFPTMLTILKALAGEELHLEDLKYFLYADVEEEFGDSGIHNIVVVAHNEEEAFKLFKKEFDSRYESYLYMELGEYCCPDGEFDKPVGVWEVTRNEFNNDFEPVD